MGRKGQVLSQGFGGIGKNEMGIRTTAQTKKIGCAILKRLVEENKILLNDDRIITELMSFVSKAQSYSAEEGHNDDLVMSLVLFAWLSRQPYFKELTNLDTRMALFQNEIKQLEEDLAPFGFISSYDEDDMKSFSDGTDVWNAEGLK